MLALRLEGGRVVKLLDSSLRGTCTLHGGSFSKWL